MTTESSPLVLLEVATGAAIPGELLDAIGDQQVADWEKHWQPAVKEITDRLEAEGVERGRWPQSHHWDWRRKTEYFRGSLSNPGFSVTAAGLTQGLMILNNIGHARLASQAGKHLAYIEFLEVAPWNWRHPLVGEPRYRAIGAALMRAAIEYSKHEGYKGRVGLHSLPQSNDWYANVCGMTDLGPDPNHHNMRYFEMTPAQAEAFIAKGNSS